MLGLHSKSPLAHLSSLLLVAKDEMSLHLLRVEQPNFIPTVLPASPGKMLQQPHLLCPASFPLPSVRTLVAAKSVQFPRVLMKDTADSSFNPAPPTLFRSDLNPSAPFAHFPTSHLSPLPSGCHPFFQRPRTPMTSELSSRTEALRS